MSTVSNVQNSTSYECCICLNPYEDKERETARKVVELSCRHYFHVDCFKPAVLRADQNADPRCCYCNQIYATSGRNYQDVFNNEELFTATLKKIQEEYAYDIRAIQGCSQLQKLYPELHNNYITHGLTDDFVKSCEYLVMEKIEECFQANVCYWTFDKIAAQWLPTSS